MIETLARQPDWPLYRKLLWSVLFLTAAFLCTRGQLAALRPAEGRVYDFFKEWAAVRNWSVGLPTYARQDIALKRHLGAELSDPEGFFDPYNTHPPTANLIALPFYRLSYQDAQFAWNLTSLAMLGITIWWIVQGLGVRLHGWHVLALLTLLLACDPLKQCLIQGQPNLLLGLLIVGAWKLDRAGRSFGAGCCIGLATAVKLYPGFLLLYFVMRRDWRGVLGWGSSLLLATLMTAALFGVAAYRDYVTMILPALDDITNNWGNASLLAFWERLLEQSSPGILPLVDAPGLLRLCVWASWLIVTVTTAVALWKSRREPFSDDGYALAVVAMLLLTPTTWHHYFVLLALPAAVLLTRYPPQTYRRWLVTACLAAAILAPRLIWMRLIPASTVHGGAEQPWSQGRMVAEPWHSATALSYQCYALLAMFCLLSPRRGESVEASRNSAAEELASRAAA